MSTTPIEISLSKLLLSLIETSSSSKILSEINDHIGEMSNPYPILTKESFTAKINSVYR